MRTKIYDFKSRAERDERSELIQFFYYIRFLVTDHL